MKPLRDIERRFWQRYVDTLPEPDRPLHARVTASYAGGREMTDDLLHLYLSGRKCAGSSIVEDFLSAGDPLPAVGDFWVLLDSDDQPGLILRTEKVVTHRFKDVPVEVAIAEGEGDLSLAYWRRVHEALYSPFLKNWGVSKMDEATVITEFFEIVFR